MNKVRWKVWVKIWKLHANIGLGKMNKEDSDKTEVQHIQKILSVVEIRIQWS